MTNIDYVLLCFIFISPGFSYRTNNCLSFHIQVLCSAMVIREDADIGSVVIGDIQKKSKCVQLQLCEAIELLSALRCTPLSLLYSGLGLEDPTDDIAEDVPLMRTLVGKYTKPIERDEVHTPRGFVAEIQDALRLKGPEDVPFRSQWPDSSSTEELAESQKDTQVTAIKIVLSPAPLSPDGLLCTMHLLSPCTTTDLNRGSLKGPWFHRTPLLTMTNSNLAVSVPRRLELPPTPTILGDTSLCSTKKAGWKDASCV